MKAVAVNQPNKMNQQTTTIPDGYLRLYQPTAQLNQDGAGGATTMRTMLQSRPSKTSLR